MDALTAEQTRSLFAASGLRSTRQREVIYAALRASHEHPTAEELHRLVQHADDGGISLATVYNALEAFTHAGLVRRLAIADGDAGGAFRYDADMTAHCHVFAGDGTVRDVPHDLGRLILARIPPDAVARIEREMGITVDRLNVEIIARPSGSPGPGENSRSAD